MVDGALGGLSIVFCFPTILFVALGTLIGMFVGAVPGLGGPVTVAVLIPVTFGMDHNMALVFLAAIIGGTSFGGSVTAILLNIPGTGKNVATCFDGFAMTQNGEPGRALGISATASALGAIFGLVVLVLLIPIVKLILMAFGPPEFFMLTLLGLSVIAVITRGSPLKGFISAGFGFLLSFIGLNAFTGLPRFNFGTQFLIRGMKLVPVIIGLFAIAQVIKLYAEGRTITRKQDYEKQIGGQWGSIARGIRDVFDHWWLFIRCSAIGTMLGAIPGVGATVGTFIAYGHAVETSPHPEKFGTGIPEGIIAPESANDSKDGGAMLPAFAFGIPGSAVWAVMLGAFLLHGIQPGPDMFRVHLDIVFALIFALLVSNVLTSAVGLLGAKSMSKITIVDYRLLTPLIFIISLVGSFALRNEFGDVIVAACFGVVGYCMDRFGYSKAATVIAMVLGDLAERNWHLAIQVHDGVSFFYTQPITLVLVVLTLVVVALPFLKGRSRENNR